MHRVLRPYRSSSEDQGLSVVEPRQENVTFDGNFTLQSEIDWLRQYVHDGEILEKMEKLRNIDEFWPSIVHYLEENQFDIEIIKRIIIQYEAHIVPNAQHLDIGQAIGYMNRGRTFHNARARYFPQGKIDTPVHYFKAAESHDIDQQQWNRFTRQPLTCYQVPGDHFSIFTMPRAREFAHLFTNPFIEFILNNDAPW
ncbi:MAG: hypothetical protein GY757_20905 [bacterium]|nr:hypothetical protein [bacterium]